MTTEYSIQKMVSDGTLSTVMLGIQYLQRNDIYMRIAGEETPQSGAPSGYTWSFIDNTTLKIIPVVPNGIEVVVYRRTDVDAMYNIYSQNAQFDEATIDENNQQLLYIAQEYLEQGLPGAGIEGVEYINTVGGINYYRFKLTDGSYTPPFGVPDGTLALRTELNMSSVPVASGTLVYHPTGTVVVYPTTPDAEMIGPGAYVAPVGTFSSDLLRCNPAKTTIFYCPDDYARSASGINYPAPFLAGFERPAMSHVISAGSKLDDETREVRRNVAFGPIIGANPIDWNLVDAFGGNPMAYAGRTERTTAIGSEVMVWFGAPDQNWLRTYQHDWWRKPAGNPYEPGESGWDSGGLETLFPGIGARIASFTDYATTSAEAGFCYGAGRDALNRIVKGIRNVAGGYGSAQNLFVGSYNVDYGSLSGCNAVFSSYCTRIGDQAGMNSNDTEYQVSVGYASGRELQGSNGATTLGAFAGAGVLSAPRAVIIGNNAGRNHPVPLTDKLVIANAPTASRAPLISGDFVSALSGINVNPENLRAKFHVRNADSGSAVSHAGGLLVESTGTAFACVETADTGEGQYRFGDTASGDVGMIAYSHASNTMTFRVNAGNQLRIEDGVLRPFTANTVMCGRTAYPWSGGFTQTAFTVTSDERHKTQPIEISDNILDAWSEVDFYQYKFLDRIEAKGDGARWHFGVIAQRVYEAFKRHGIDGFEIGLLCYDKWELEPAVYRDLTHDEIESGAYPSVQTKILVTPELEAGDKWGIVYDEALALEAALQRRNYQRLLLRVHALETKGGVYGS